MSTPNTWENRLSVRSARSPPTTQRWTFLTSILKFHPHIHNSIFGTFFCRTSRSTTRSCTTKLAGFAPFLDASSRPFRWFNSFSQFLKASQKYQCSATCWPKWVRIHPQPNPSNSLNQNLNLISRRLDQKNVLCKGSKRVPSFYWLELSVLPKTT